MQRSALKIDLFLPKSSNITCTWVLSSEKANWNEKLPLKMILWVLGIREIFHFFRVSFLLLYLDLPSQVCISSLPISCSLFATSARETSWFLVLLAVLCPPSCLSKAWDIQYEAFPYFCSTETSNWPKPFIFVWQSFYWSHWLNSQWVLLPDLALNAVYIKMGRKAKRCCQLASQYWVQN